MVICWIRVNKGVEQVDIPLINLELPQEAKIVLKEKSQVVDSKF